MQVEMTEVRQALENHELEPSFQPLVEIRTGRLTGFEILARWRHPQVGLCLPENFISLGEKLGLMSQLTQQVMQKAFLSAELIIDTLTLAINISPTQLQNAGLPDLIRTAARLGCFPLNRLTIEITETALLKDPDRARAIVTELKSMGCKLSLDDFGTGYSSLSHLQSLPFDQLKIDRSFVSSMTTTRESRKIVAAIIGLGNSLGLVTIAEGVETEEQADMLLWLGCQQAQGWLYGRPVPGEELPALIASPPRAISAGLSTPGDGWAVSSLEALPTQRLAQLQAIYDGAPVGLCFLDRNLRYVSLNRRFADMSGATIAQHLGKTIQEMIPEVFPALESYLHRALQGEAILDVEISGPALRTGERDWMALLSYQPALDEADEVIGVSIAVLDVTNRRTNPTLHDDDDHERLLLGANPAMPWVMDAEGNSLNLSSDWLRTTWWYREHKRNLGWLEALHPDDLEKIMKTMKLSLRSGTPIDVEYRIQDLEGNWKWMRSRGTAKLDPWGDISRWYGVVEDIGQPKHAKIHAVAPKLAS